LFDFPDFTDRLIQSTLNIPVHRTSTRRRRATTAVTANRSRTTAQVKPTAEIAVSVIAEPTRRVTTATTTNRQSHLKAVLVESVTPTANPDTFQFIPEQNKSYFINIYS